jgi:hypothetical protein
MNQLTFLVWPEFDILSAASGRVWGIVKPDDTWATYGDLTPSERKDNWPTQVLRYREKSTALRVALKLAKRAGGQLSKIHEEEINVL